MLPGALRNPYKRRALNQEAWKRAQMVARRSAGEALGKGHRLRGRKPGPQRSVADEEARAKDMLGARARPPPPAARLAVGAWCAGLHVGLQCLQLRGFAGVGCMRGIAVEGFRTLECKEGCKDGVNGLGGTLSFICTWLEVNWSHEGRLIRELW